MRKQFCLLVILCGLVTNVDAYTGQHALIKNYIKNNFPADFVVNTQQIDQLAWAFNHDRHTPDLDFKVKDQQMYVEISRALTRLYCARLLRSGGFAAYQKFAAAQHAQAIHEQLSFASFTKLSAHIQQLNALDYELLEAASILSAVSLSKPAAKLAQQVMDVDPVMNDNMGFLAATLRHGVNIYPLTAKITTDNAAAKKLMYILFPPQTNFRHMLYTEGGVGMYKYLRTMIRHGFIDRAGLDLWLAHWIVNISGFRGHIDQRGSCYLDENVAQSILNLKPLIYEMLDCPNFDPLQPYLEYRATCIGLTHLPKDDRLFFAHLAGLLRVYSVADGQKLYTLVQQIPQQHLIAAKRYFMQGLKDVNQSTNIHLPALFANAIEISAGDFATVIKQLLPVYNAILFEASRQNVKNSLAFNHLSKAQAIKVMLKQNAAHEQRFKILKDGTVLLG